MKMYVYEIKTHDPETGKFEAEQMPYTAPDAVTAQSALMDYLRCVTTEGKSLISVELMDAYIL